MRIAPLALATLLLLACGGEDSTSPPIAAPADVLIVTGASGLGANAYAPPDLTISLAAKQTVKWRNNDNIDHTVTEDNGVFGSAALGQGGTYTFVFDTPGVYAYHCSIHPTMVATITVNP